MNRNLEFDEVTGPFGAPEGAWQDLGEQQLVRIPAEFGGIGRSPQDGRVRIVAGALGSGKSLLIRLMQDYQHRRNSPAVFAPAVQRSSDLRTEDVVKFQRQIGTTEGNSEVWKLAWRRAITRCTVSQIRGGLSDYLTDEASDFFANNARLLGAPQRGPRSVIHELKEIISSHSTGRTYRLYLDDDEWAEIDSRLSTVTSELPPIFLYLDDVDKEFKSAPSAWTHCQKGLMYTIMDLQREAEFQGRVHIIAALRDTTIASVGASEHAQRVLDPTYVNMMEWDRSAAKFFFQEKIAKLPSRFFVEQRQKDVASFLNRTDVVNARDGDRSTEPILDYLLRHTSLVPRDMIRTGNRICDFIDKQGHESMTDELLRDLVRSQARGFAEKLLTVCGNQFLSGILPPDAWNNSSLVWARDAVLSCIEMTGSEVITEAEMKILDEFAMELFADHSTGKTASLSDILWQNRLVGARRDNGEISFFSLDDVGNMLRLPRVGGHIDFIWHPILFDVTSALRIRLPEAAWPK